MTEVPEVKLIFTLTIVFVVGTFVFVVIFNALITLQELQANLMHTTSDAQTTSELLQIVPWALGGLYLTLVGVIAYFMYRKYKKVF